MKLTTYIIVGLLFNEFISFLSAIMLNVYNGKTQYGSNDSFEEWSRLTIAASILASISMTKLIHMDCDMTSISLPSKRKRLILAVILFVSGTFNFLLLLLLATSVFSHSLTFLLNNKQLY